MRTSAFLISLVSVSILPILGAPNPLDAQAVFGVPHSTNNFEDYSGIASHFLSEGKKAILKGKNNMETWYHDGKEYLKQDNLLCT